MVLIKNSIHSTISRWPVTFGIFPARFGIFPARLFLDVKLAKCEREVAGKFHFGHFLTPLTVGFAPHQKKDGRQPPPDRGGDFLISVGNSTIFVCAPLRCDTVAAA
jgi:hypothetical protein